MAPRGRPPKNKGRNISGLRNQPPAIPQPALDQPDLPDPLPTDSDLVSDLVGDTEDDHWNPEIYDDSLHAVYAEEQSDADGDISSEEEGKEEEEKELGITDWDDLDSLEVNKRLWQMALEQADVDWKDLDWVPPKDQAKKRKRALEKKREFYIITYHIVTHRTLARPQTYATGPDIARKAERTQRRYRKSTKTQTTLDASLLSVRPPARKVHVADQGGSTMTAIELDLSDTDSSASDSGNALGSDGDTSLGLGNALYSGNSSVNNLADLGTSTAETVSEPPSSELGDNDQESNPYYSEPGGDPDHSEPGQNIDSDDSFSVPRLGDDSDLGADNAQTQTQFVPEDDDDGDDQDDPDNTPAWESELEEALGCKGPEIRSWEVLRAQINTDLKKKHRKFTMTQTNQLLMIRNFATLQIKGVRRIPASTEIARQWHPGEGHHFARRIRALARHYQVFEQLPQEKRGGVRGARSLLYDGTIRNAARTWLLAQKAGDVTPRRFQYALNTEILPGLGVNLTKPLCERTARRWLIRFGFRLTLLKKGVYMDGHERPDVVEYRKTVFLPKMAEYEKRMAHYEGPDLVCVEPTLGPGKRKIIALFHDESCFHANDFKGRVWYVDVYS